MISVDVGKEIVLFRELDPVDELRKPEEIGMLDKLAVEIIVVEF